MKKIFFFFMVGANILCAANAFAHGTHFHSLAELSEHIDGHIGRLEAKLAGDELSRDEIKQECRELVEHAKQYQILARTLIRKKENVQMAKSLDAISESLVSFARQRDLQASLDILRQIQVLLRP